jgi:HSP20 family protein
MAVVRWEPMREPLTSLQSEMNRLFSAFFDAGGTGEEGGAGTALRRWVPPMDLIETDDEFVLRADLPGLSEGDVRLEVEDNILTISGDRRPEHEGKGEGFYRLERPYGPFSRRLTLPEGIDPDQIKARFEKGVLEVRIPKPQQRQPHKVQIAVGGRPEAIEGQETHGAPSEGGATPGGQAPGGGAGGNAPGGQTPSGGGAPGGQAPGAGGTPGGQR